MLRHYDAIGLLREPAVVAQATSAQSFNVVDPAEVDSAALIRLLSG